MKTRWTDEEETNKVSLNANLKRRVLERSSSLEEMLHSDQIYNLKLVEKTNLTEKQEKTPKKEKKRI